MDIVSVTFVYMNRSSKMALKRVLWYLSTPSVGMKAWFLIRLVSKAGQFFSANQSSAVQTSLTIGCEYTLTFLFRVNGVVPFMEHIHVSSERQRGRAKNDGGLANVLSWVRI